MPVKDPRINAFVVSGKVSKDYEERANGDYINGKVTMEIFNLCYDRETKKKEYKPIAIEVKTLGRPDAKQGSTLAIMRGLKVGDRIVVTGALECDFWMHQEKQCSKMFIQASRVQTFESEDKPAAKAAPAQDEPDEDGDLPF